MDSDKELWAKVWDNMTKAAQDQRKAQGIDRDHLPTGWPSDGTRTKWTKRLAEPLAERLAGAKPVPKTPQAPPATESRDGSPKTTLAS